VAESGLPAIHPGRYLREILDELGISQAELARSIGVAPMRISYVVHEARPVTAEFALLLGRAFGQSARYWLNLQAAYDLRVAKEALGEKRLDAVTALQPE